MTKSTSHICFLLIVTILVSLITPFLQQHELELPIVLVSILFTGVPHGSFDHHVAQYTNKKQTLIFFFVKYLFLSGLVLLLWVLLPVVAFLFFLLITAWHFGETDTEVLDIKPNHFIVKFTLGTCILFWLLTQNPIELTHWIDLVVKSNSHFFSGVSSISSIHNALVFSVICVILVSSVKKSNALERVSFLIFLFALSKTSLLLGFSIYFCGWHSIITLKTIKTSVFSKMKWKKVIRYSFPIMLATAAIFFAIIFLRENAWLKEHALTSVFVLLSILTLPHLLEMHSLYNKLRIKSK